MHTIRKYRFHIDDYVEIEMPLGAKIVSIQNQYENPVFYAIVNKKAAESNLTRTRYFRIFGTGHDIERIDPLIYIGSVQFAEGRLVFHVFEEKKRDQ